MSCMLHAPAQDAVGQVVLRLDAVGQVDESLDTTVEAWLVAYLAEVGAAVLVEAAAAGLAVGWRIDSLFARASNTGQQDPDALSQAPPADLWLPHSACVRTPKTASTASRALSLTPTWTRAAAARGSGSGPCPPATSTLDGDRLAALRLDGRHQCNGERFADISSTVLPTPVL